MVVFFFKSCCGGIFVLIPVVVVWLFLFLLWWYFCFLLWWYVCADSWFVGSGMSAGWADNHGDAAAIKVGKLSYSVV